MSLLKKLKLSKELNKVVETDLDNFYINFKNTVAERRVFKKFEQIDFLFNSDKELIGSVNKNKFDVRRNKKNKTFSFNSFPTIAKGDFKKNDNQTIVNCKISAINFSAGLYYIVFSTFILFFFIGLMLSNNSLSDKMFGFIIFAFFLLIGVVLPYIAMIKDVEKLYKLLNEKL